MIREKEQIIYMDENQTPCPTSGRESAPLPDGSRQEVPGVTSGPPSRPL